MRKTTISFSIDSLTELNEAAESLSKHKGDLRLNVPTELSSVQRPNLTNMRWVILNSLTELSDAAAESLSKHRVTYALVG